MTLNSQHYTLRFCFPWNMTIVKKKPFKSCIHCVTVIQKKILLKEWRGRNFLIPGKELGWCLMKGKNEQGAFPCKETHVFGKKIKIETLNDYRVWMEWWSCFLEIHWIWLQDFHCFGNFHRLILWKIISTYSFQEQPRSLLYLCSSFWNPAIAIRIDLR